MTGFLAHLLRYVISPFFLWGLLFCSQSSAEAQRRVALLIGNGAYREVSILPNPRRDVALIAKTFREAGFDVVDVTLDMDRSAMVRAIRAFEDKVQGADIGVVFYAGHGIEVNGQNYLIPIDAKLASDKDIDDETVPLDRVMRALDGAKRLRLVILDACRDNPFAPKMTRSTGTRSIGRGLAQMEPVNSDTLVAFAAKAGTTALDGSTGNSPYTLAIAKHITTKDLDIRIALGRIRDEVLKSTNKMQEPFLYGSLGGDTLSLASAEVPIPYEKTAASLSPVPSSSLPPPVQSVTDPSQRTTTGKNDRPDAEISKPIDTVFWRVRLNVSQGIQNVRSGPGTGNPILFSIPAGLGGITLQDCKLGAKPSASEWCFAKWQNKSGWLSVNGLEREPQTR